MAELKASLAIDPNRAPAPEASRTAEGFAAAGQVDPAPSFAAAPILIEL